MLVASLVLSAVGVDVVAAAGRYGIPAHVALHVAWRESGMDPRAVRHERNGTRSLGVMQINTRAYPAAPSMTDRQRIDAGVSRLAKEWRKCGGDAACAWRRYRGAGR